jgi:hypothetical protein
MRSFKHTLFVPHYSQEGRIGDPQGSSPLLGSAATSSNRPDPKGAFPVKEKTGPRYALTLMDPHEVITYTYTYIYIHMCIYMYVSNNPLTP